MSQIHSDPSGPGSREPSHDVSRPSASIPIADDQEMVSCERCSKKTPHEEAACSEGCYFCPECWAEWTSIFNACQHEWSEEPYYDEYGDPGLICNRCHGVIAYIDRAEGRS